MTDQQRNPTSWVKVWWAFWERKISSPVRKRNAAAAVKTKTYLQKLQYCKCIWYATLTYLVTGSTDVLKCEGSRGCLSCYCWLFEIIKYTRMYEFSVCNWSICQDLLMTIDLKQIKSSNFFCNNISLLLWTILL